MKDGTLYAGKLKRAYSRLRQSVPAPQVPEPDDPIQRLALAILGEDCGDGEAARAIERMFTTLVDWNEVRVSTPDQVHRAMGARLPDGIERARRLIRALQGVYEHEHRISLERLRNMGRREARQFLESIHGINDYSAAAVMLWSFGGHAIPVNDGLHAALREAELVHPQATRVEVQAFLERNVPATNTKEFCLVMRSFKPSRRPASGSSAKPSKPARKTEKTAPQ